MPTDEAWRKDAACRGMSLALFFSDKSGQLLRAGRRVCDSCPVSSECLEDAIWTELHGNYQVHGLRGGFSRPERLAIINKRRRDARRVS
jgi:hypothetical protein